MDAATTAGMPSGSFKIPGLKLSPFGSGVHVSDG
jgi:hypothetical protein